jgi:hypothetical protein
MLLCAVDSIVAWRSASTGAKYVRAAAIVQGLIGAAIVRLPRPASVQFASSLISDQSISSAVLPLRQQKAEEDRRGMRYDAPQRAKLRIRALIS